MLTIIDLSSEEKLDEFTRQVTLPRGTYMEVEDSSGEISHAIFIGKGDKRVEVECNETYIDAVTVHQIDVVLYIVQTALDVVEFAIKLGREGVICEVLSTEQFLELYPESQKRTLH